MKRSPRRGIYKVVRVFGVSVFLLLLLSSLGWVYRSSFLTGSLKVEIARQGSIDHLQTVAAVFANEETLLKAPGAGTPEFLVQEGERVRKGDLIARIHSGGVALGQENAASAHDLYTSSGGIVFSAIDGLETYLTPENLLAMDVGKILQPTQGLSATQEAQESPPSQSSESVAAGKVIGKIVNNLKPTVAVLKVETKGYEVGKSVKLIINDQNYSAKILRLLDDPHGLVVQFNQYINGTSQKRLQDISLVQRPSVSGVLVPKSSLWNKGEELGVYVVKEGAIQYRKVKILDQNDQFICVENLPHGIPVITNPRMGIDGLIMNIKNVSQS
ncbi:HlyD family efflux transporter periplasmic adaptor subunit [Desulfitobacterium chlororespirans]|uniref:Putative membrane fusion protein n=1 Tax=Desulfitobacterium chlororespirans DSM 11544 TaxID=1121395 RepID=A0A1M7UEG7_9FIRM|nr:HlyD family efflux transporter periplasmic adaptor subunit [Desulfitobacterium chlororespirans]SHN81412.1 putative membrane fusion protein [Desulfitobacterium chlororespirans DSM 11544]